MGKCLKQQLKEIIQNDSLKKLNESMIHVFDAVNQPFRLLNITGTTRIPLRSSGEFDAIEDTTNNKVYIGNGSGYIFFDRNDIGTLNLPADIFNVDWNDIKYCNNLKELVIYKQSISNINNISIFKNNLALTLIDLRGTGWEGDINSLPDTLLTFRINDGNININGNFDLFGNKPLTTLGSFRGTSVSGTIEGFVATARKPITEGGANRRTGNILIESTYAWKNITFNDNPIIGANNVTLSWTADTITLNDVTINA